MFRAVRFSVLSSLMVHLAAAPCPQDSTPQGNLTLHIALVNDRPIPGEPLKLRVTIENTSSIALEIPSVIDKATLSFECSRGEAVKETLSPADYLSNKGSRPRQLAPQESVVTCEMLTSIWDSTSVFQEPGDYAVTATFKGKRSNTLRVSIKEPEGIDKGAFEHLRDAKLLRYLTLYWDGPLKEKPAGELKVSLERFPASRFTPWVQIALANHELFAGHEDLRALKSDSRVFSRAVSLLEGPANNPKFPFCSEVTARLGKLYVSAGLNDFGKGLLIRAREANDIPDSWRNEIGAVLKKSELLK